MDGSFTSQIRGTHIDQSIMGIIYQQVAPVALPPDDLRVTIQSTCLVYPSPSPSPSPSPQQQFITKSLFLSNIDQVVNFDVQTVHFFRSHSRESFPIELVAEKLKNALANVLVSYDFLGGRLKTNHVTGRLEIDCNSGGAGFVVANSGLTLDQIGDLVYPNLGFGQLAIQTLDDDRNKPLCIVQVTSFKCGGFVIGMCNNHAIFDGISFKAFLENLAACAFAKPLAITPCHDRHLLAARSPPCVTFPHPELVKLTQESSSSANHPILLDATQETLAFQIFRLTSVEISALKDKAIQGGGGREACVSGFNAITAHIWRCKALTCDIDNNNNNDNLAVDEADRLSTVLYSVDIRPRLRPPLPASYTGNAVLTAYATATCRELEEGPLWRLVEKVKEGAKRITSEYARSMIDWGETNKGYPQGDLLVSSWLKLGFGEVEYPWGRPIYSCPVVSPRKNLILLFPDMHDKDGANVLVSLPTNQMEKFQSLFHMLL